MSPRASAPHVCTPPEALLERTDLTTVEGDKQIPSGVWRCKAKGCGAVFELVRDSNNVHSWQELHRAS